jgi:hypothetical protein
MKIEKAINPGTLPIPLIWLDGALTAADFLFARKSANAALAHFCETNTACNGL